MLENIEFNLCSHILIMILPMCSIRKSAYSGMKDRNTLDKAETQEEITSCNF